MKKFAKCLCVIIGAFVFISALAGCNKDKPSSESTFSIPSITSQLKLTSTEMISQETYYEKPYNDIIENEFKLNGISKSVADAGAVSEFRVVNDYAWGGDDYYSLGVMKDGTGKFTYSIHTNGTEGTSPLRTKTLTAGETKSLIKAIEDNDFWNIPAIHPEEKLGLDGNTIMIEGYQNGKSHFIKMWIPDEKYGISKIHKAFADFASTLK